MAEPGAIILLTKGKEEENSGDKKGVVGKRV